MAAEGNTIVKSVIRDQEKAPCIILYNDEQIQDLKNVCCSGKSILGEDKTFNLCDMHVTTTCYKQVSVKRNSTQEPPIFLGPVFIHDNSDFQSISNFFNHLKVKLSDVTTDQLVLGSDEELALVNAITAAFPDATHVLCTRHLRENAKQKLIDNSINKQDRDSILDDIFGNEGLVCADDTICFNEKSTVLEEKSTALFQILQILPDETKNQHQRKSASTIFYWRFTKNVDKQ